MVEIRRIKFREAAEHPDFDALLEEYGDEAGMYGMPRPDCQVDMYDKMEQAGILHVIGAFKQDVLAGFISVVVCELPHYGQMMATTESFFVRSDHRKTGAGLLLLKDAETLATEFGAFGLLVSAPFGGRLAEVLPNKGYTETNRVFFRRLS